MAPNAFLHISVNEEIEIFVYQLANFRNARCRIAPVLVGANRQRRLRIKIIVFGGISRELPNAFEHRWRSAGARNIFVIQKAKNITSTIILDTFCQGRFMPMGGMLDHVRVLELSAPPTMLAGRILGDLGADVVVIEPIGGAAGRRLDPFVDGVPGLDRSLTWQALNYNKRAITLDWRRPDGRALLQQLCQGFDIVIELAIAGQPSAFDDVKLPAKAVHCVLTQFSKDGPKASYKSSELVLMAASGSTALAGPIAREPLFFPVPQAIMEAGAEAAIAALSALAARDRDGLGQRVEVSVRVAALAGALGKIIRGFSGDVTASRTVDGDSSFIGTNTARSMYRTGDGGYVNISILFAAHFHAMNQSIAQWLMEEGALDAETAQFDWRLYTRGREQPSREPCTKLEQALATVCARYSKLEVVAEARKRGFMAAPIMGMNDIAQYEQYRQRGLFAKTQSLPDGREIDVPARFAQLAGEPIEIRRPAPRLSEHTAELLTRELGLSASEVQALFVHEVI